MSTKLHRVVLSITDFGTEYSKTAIKSLLENHRYLESIKVLDIKTANVGKTDDDHELNRVGVTKTNFEKYFPELSFSESDLSKEVTKERDLRLQSDRKYEDLKSEVKALKKQLKTYEKLEKLIKNLKRVNRLSGL